LEAVMKRPTFLPYAIGLLLISTGVVFAGTTTLTTYYPAPSGNYSQLRLVPQAALSGACDPGTLYVENTNNTLQYCDNSSTWRSAVPPSGMIAMFATSCPAGWTRFSALDGLYPRGSGSYGGTGGSATHDHQHNHNHSVSALNGDFTTTAGGDHSHDVDVDHQHTVAGTTQSSGNYMANTDDTNGWGIRWDHVHNFSTTSDFMAGGGNRTTATNGDHTHNVNVNFGGTNTGNPDNSQTGTENNEPPYLDIVFCSKD
ncbi:MAG: hypothetical protein Q7K71_04650, partial [Candidatus Omnitrophota bacterium]|nr:hypothetical protein [Candidatus Omnitrophota bacterium]